MDLFFIQNFIWFRIILGGNVLDKNSECGIIEYEITKCHGQLKITIIKY